MNVEASIIIAGAGIVASVVGSHVALRTEFKTSLRYLEEDIGDIKRRVLNGYFVRRDECVHCNVKRED